MFILLPIRDIEHHLAHAVAMQHVTVSFLPASERQDLRNDRPYVSLIDQLGDFRQLLAVLLNNKPDRLYIVGGSPFGWQRHGDGDKFPASAQHALGSLPRRSSDSVEHQIGIVDVFLEPCGFVVKDLIRPQVP